jgi:hypothetical protein
MSGIRTRRKGELLGAMDELAPGVLGYAMDVRERGLYVPIIHSTEEGKGNVGRFLDRLKERPLVKIPNVMSAVLRGMLDRRGFVVEREYAEDFGESVEVWVWRKP